MAGFKDYKGTPFVPYLLPIIPRGEPLSPTSNLTAEKLGKIPGLRNPDTGEWVGFDWPNFNIYDNNLAGFASWYANRPVETVGVNARELIGFDSDSDHPVVAKIVRDTLDDVLGWSCGRVRPGSDKFLRCYRLKAGSAPIRKRPGRRG
jgi:hypothetical protein